MVLASYAGASGRVYGVPDVSGDSRLQTDVLESLSDARRYREWLAGLALPHLGDHPIEIGSGNGDYALEWAPYVKQLTATEADRGRYASLAERFADHPVIRPQYLLLGQDQAEAPADSLSSELQGSQARSSHRATLHTGAVALNVFEHIPDDVAAMRALRTLVQPGGAIVIMVPAFPSAMSRFDRAIGHHRRYTRASLREVFTQAGLVVSDVRYINPIGLLTWYVAVKAGNMAPKNGAALRLYDSTIVPLVRAMNRWFAAPFGQTVVGIARVPH